MTRVGAVRVMRFASTCFTGTAKPSTCRRAQRASPQAHTVRPSIFAFGKHRGEQYHVEMTPQLIATRYADWDQEVRSFAEHRASVQVLDQLLAAVKQKAAQPHAVADSLIAIGSKVSSTECVRRCGGGCRRVAVFHVLRGSRAGIGMEGSFGAATHGQQFGLMWIST